MTEIKDYLSTPERPVGMQELREFWEKCSSGEKENIRKAVRLSKL
jgi:hypothetical protein